MYIASAALKRFHDDGRPAEDRCLLDWSCDLAAWKIEEALDGILLNLPNRWLGCLLRPVIFPLGRHRRPPQDSLGAEITSHMLDNGAMRDRLSGEIFLPNDQEEGLGQLMAAENALIDVRPIRLKIRQAIKQGQLAPDPVASQPERAKATDIITAAECKSLVQALKLQDQAIQVRSYKPVTHSRLKG